MPRYVRANSAAGPGKAGSAGAINKADGMSALSYAAMGLVVCGNVLGNIFLKIGATTEPERAVFFGMFGWQTIMGIGCFAGAVLCYAFALRVLPLHLAQSIAALQFVGAVTAAYIIFGEPIDEMKWIGILMICGGLVLVAN